MLAAALYLATFTPEPPHFDFIWLTFKGDQVRLESAEQPGVEQVELDDEVKDWITFQTLTKTEIKGTVEGNFLVTGVQPTDEFVCAEGDFGFDYDHRNEEKYAFCYTYPKVIRGTSRLEKVYGMEMELYLKKVEGNWTARVRYKGKDTADFTMWQFFPDPEAAIKHKPGEYVSLGRTLPDPLWLAAYVYEERSGQSYGTAYDVIQHGATLTWAAPK